jgi:hypothetical protein
LTRIGTKGPDAGVKVTAAVPAVVPSTTLVAFTVTVCCAVIEAGAVYKPFTSVPTSGVTDHVTPVLELPVTVAVNCCVWLCSKFTPVGLMLTCTTGVKVTIAAAEVTPSATLVAFTVTVC